MRNKHGAEDNLIDFIGKTQRKTPRIGVIHTKREEKPMKRILQQEEDYWEALREIHDYLEGEYDGY